MASEIRKPLPDVNEDSKPFWDAAKNHELVLNRCRTCGTFAPVQYPLGGTGCLVHGDTDMEWVKVSGRGTLFTFVLFHQQFHPAFKEDLPYNVALIELEEGPLLLSNVIDCPNENLSIGMPLQVVFEDVSEEEALPKFRPAE